jgi:transposase
MLTTFQRQELKKSLMKETRWEYCLRIEIMLMADGGKSQTNICNQLGCSQITAKYWIAIAQAGKALCWRERPIGRPKMIDEAYLNRLAEIAARSPREFGYPFQRWTGEWLSKHLEQELSIKLSARHVNRLLQKARISSKFEPTKHFRKINSTNRQTAKEGVKRCHLIGN